MVDPSVRVVGTPAFTNSATVSVQVPPTAQIGDLLVLWHANGAAANPATPAGWNLVASGQTVATILGVMLLTRPCQAGDPGSSVVLASAGTARRIGVCVALKDVNSTTPVDFVSTALLSTASANSRAAPTGTAVAGGLQLLFVSDKAAGTVPPNDGMASDTFGFPAGYAQVYATRSGAGVSAGDTSLAMALGPMSSAGAALGGGNWTCHYINVRGGSVLMSVRSGTPPPPVYPQLDVLVSGTWVRANVLGVGASGVLAPVDVLDLATTPAPPTPDLAFNFNDGVMPSAFVNHAGSATNAAAAYSGAYGVRMTPDAVSGIATLTISGAQFPAGQPWCGFKLRFRLNTAPSPTNTYMNLFEIGNALVSAPKSQFTVFFDSGNLTADFNAGEEQIIAGTPAAGGWHLLEVRVGFGGTSYQSRIRFDGGPTITFNSPATKTPTTASVLWIHYPGTAVDYEMDVDDIALVTSASDPGFF